MSQSDDLALMSMNRENRAVKFTIRQCLKCDKDFKSKGSHNRICESCNEINKRMIDTCTINLTSSGRTHAKATT